jgi:hypothetical protein
MLPTRMIVSGVVGAILLAGAAAVSAQPIAVDPTNPQYFRFQNQTIPLIGFSAEYICPISFSPTNNAICTLETYPSFLNTLASPAGINKIRLWVGLNHSPNKMGAGTVITTEQPFAWNAGAGK